MTFSTFFIRIVKDAATAAMRERTRENKKFVSILLHTRLTSERAKKSSTTTLRVHVKILLKDTSLLDYCSPFDPVQHCGATSKTQRDRN
jgi:hypothetical protein